MNIIITTRELSLSRKKCTVYEAGLIGREGVTAKAINRHLQFLDVVFPLAVKCVNVTLER